MVSISIPCSTLPWQFYMLCWSLQNQKTHEPPYYSQCKKVQQVITYWFCNRVSEYQIQSAFQLKSKIPTELIWKIIDYNVPILKGLDCFELELEKVDHGKEMITLFSLLSPEYVVIVHQKVWIVSFSKEVFMIGLFTVGYSSLLKYIWLL
jgi:hypothetical protein